MERAMFYKNTMYHNKWTAYRFHMMVLQASKFDAKCVILRKVTS